ncbi:WG repeat-containing protein [Actinoplanes sp. NPDC023936]|uniref:tetratricopeptide repeat protein n=1 Tax=Actinoplanes sp. NPDC023936 TaxID=3154910 RepID=UPI0033F9D94B
MPGPVSPPANAEPVYGASDVAPGFGSSDIGPGSGSSDIGPVSVVGEERTQPIEVRRADLAGSAVAPERDFEHTQVIDTRRAGAHAAPYEETAETPVAPAVGPRPAAHARPEEPARAETPVEIPEPEEPHGLGWLLSMSGLGATTPVPEAEVEPAEAEAEAVTEVRPQGWFAPALETTEEVAEEVAEEATAEPVAEEVAAEQPVAEELAADEPVSDEPVSDEPVLDEPVSDEPVAEELAADELVPDEPVLDEPVLDEPVLDEPVAEELVVEELAVDEPLIVESTTAEPSAVEIAAVEADVDEVPADDADSDEPDLETAVAEILTEEPLPQEAAEEPVAQEAIDEETVADEPLAEEVHEVELLPAEEPVSETLPEAEAEAEAEDEDELGYDKPFADFQSFGGQAIAEEPVTELIAEPATELIAEPVTELIVEPVTELIVEPVTELIVEPPTELIVEPPTALIEEPAAEEPATVVIATSLAGTLSDEETAPLDALITVTIEETAPTADGSETDTAEPETAEPDTTEPIQLETDASDLDDAPPAETTPLASPLPVNDQTASLAAGEPAPSVPKVRQRRDQRAGAERRRADPEQILASFPWTFDPQTLREQVDEPERLWDLIDRLTDRLEFAERDNVRAGLLSLRAVVSRVLGELDDALADGREALRHAEASGELRPVSIAQARLAQVLQWRGEFAEADRLYAQADSVELPSRVRAEILELAGRSAFEQGRFLEAVNHFERALDVRQGGDPDLVERIELALDTITQKTNATHWGPYPRTRDELLGLPAAPTPLPDEGTGLWGYAAAVEPRYAEVQPFAEGVAWVRRPETPAWELIDPSGAVVISADEGYLGAGPFAEGLAWVSREPEGGWFAVNRQGHTVVPGDFEDARPFRRGMALIRQGGVWGAIDRTGRVAVPPHWPAFATSLHVGGEIDGFTGEGLAVVDAGGRFGVLDRTGKLVIEPTWAAVVIHPSAFLVRDAAGHWGALSRTGEPLTEMTHPDRAAAAAAIDDEARPVL